MSDTPDLVAELTAPHRDKGLGKGRRKFRVERVMLKMNFWRRLWYLLAGGVIVFEAARAPQRVSGVEVLDLRVLSWWGVRKLERARREAAEKDPLQGMVDDAAHQTEVETNIGNAAIRALKDAAKGS